jgi:hypothetical protein
VTATETPRPNAQAPNPQGRAPLFAARALRASGKVLPEHARSHNRSLVLQTLYTAGAQSRADVARETALTRVTVSDLVAELIAEGFVVELGPREDARPGKPATLIDIDRTGFHIVALDLSEHTRFRGAVLDLDGAIVARAEVALDGATGERAVELVVELLDGLLALTTVRVLGIGVGSPGVVEPDGVVRSAPNLGWSDLPLQERLTAAFHLPVHVANDANVAALAEHATAPGDLILIYLGAPERQFIGRAELASAVHDWTPSEAQVYPGDSHSGVLLARVEEWDPPVPMNAVLSRIDPAENAKADFQAGVVRITANEYETALAVAGARAPSPG